MKPSTKNQIKGNLHEVKGAAKQKVGELTDDPKMVAAGKKELLVGKLMKKAGQIGKVFGK